MRDNANQVGGANYLAVTFIEEWGTRYQAIGKLWREQWARVIPFFALSEEIRKGIYRTHAVKSLHMSLRKIIS